MTTTGKLSERITPELAAKTAKLLGWGIDKDGFLIHLLHSEEASQKMFNGVADLLRVSEAMAEALQRAQEELRLIRTKDADVVYDVGLRVTMSAALAEWKKLSKK